MQGTNLIFSFRYKKGKQKTMLNRNRLLRSFVFESHDTIDINDMTFHYNDIADESHHIIFVHKNAR